MKNRNLFFLSRKFGFGALAVLVLVLALVIKSLHTNQNVRSLAATAPPPTGGYFTTLLPGSTLPTDAQCAAQVHHSPWEPRTENNVPNNTIPSSVSIGGFTPNDGGVDQRARALADRVTGNFTGTTDEIIQWAACKWGFNDDIVRATAVTESDWYQGQKVALGNPINGHGFGDFSNNASYCEPGYTVPCPTSFGILQVKNQLADTGDAGSYPNSASSTAFNIDYALMVRRICYEGWTNWLYTYPGATVAGQPAYAAGDEWGCVGEWYSGQWRDQGALNYIATVQNYYNSKPWLLWADHSLIPDVNGIVTVNDDLTGTSTNQFEYVGTWYPITQAGAYGTNEHVAYNNGDYYQLRFHGTKMTLYSQTDPTGGTANVSIDGGVTSAINFNSASTQYKQSIYTSPNLTLGDHIVKVINTSNSATAYTMWVDYAEITNPSSVTPTTAATPTSNPTPTATPTSKPTPTPSLFDTTSPTVTIVSPRNGAQVAHGHTIVITANASDNVGVAKVEFYVNGSLKCTDSTALYTCNWLVPTKKGVAYTIKAIAYDGAGNTAQSIVVVLSY